MIHLDFELFLEVFEHCCLHGVRYQLGAKAPSLTCDTSRIEAIDCSGFVRYILARATHQQLVIPDGSVNQHDWCRRQELSVVPYGGKGFPTANALFIAFIAPVYEKRPGHVWLVWKGQTLESYGGQGVGSRPWNVLPLMRREPDCYQLWRRNP